MINGRVYSATIILQLLRILNSWVQFLVHMITSSAYGADYHTIGPRPLAVRSKGLGFDSWTQTIVPIHHLSPCATDIPCLATSSWAEAWILPTSLLARHWYTPASLSSKPKICRFLPSTSCNRMITGCYDNCDKAKSYTYGSRHNGGYTVTQAIICCDGFEFELNVV